MAAGESEEAAWLNGVAAATAGGGGEGCSG